MDDWRLHRLESYLHTTSKKNRIIKYFNNIRIHITPFTKTKKRIIQILSGVFILIFLSVYAAAQLTAGSKALNVMLGWPTNTGIIIGAFIVLIYSFSGGIRASIWTDVVQSIIMLISMSGLLLVALINIGGLKNLFHQLNLINTNLTTLVPSDLTFGFFPYLAGWIAFGLGVIGQPHIIVRPMVIASPHQIKTARRLYLSWYAIFSICAIGVGLCARILLPELGNSDQELALPVLANQLLPSIFVGGVLAGLFSATISTADSQVLSCSATLTQDINPAWKNKLNMSKISTAIIMIATVLIALYGTKNVYTLVILAWSALSVVLGPLIALKCINIKIGFKTSLTIMIGSLLTIILWRQQLNLSNDINEVLPGIVIALIYS